MAKIIGIRYVGKKPEAEDTITNSGAVWIPGQVHNFAEPLARLLLVHTDSFAEAPVSGDGDVFMGGKTQAHSEPAAYVNLNAMGREQMVFYARREFNRIMEVEGKTDDQIRNEIQNLMVVANLDEIAREKTTGECKLKVAIPVTEAELEALNNGTLKVRIVPDKAESLESNAMVRITPAQALVLMAECDVDTILDNPDDYALISKNAPTLRDAYETLRILANMADAGIVGKQAKARKQSSAAK